MPLTLTGSELVSVSLIEWAELTELIESLYQSLSAG